jgi:nucleoside phosphorylase
VSPETPPDGSEPQRGIGILCALAAELGGLARVARRRHQRQGLELLELDPAALGSAGASLASLGPLLACVGGVGKVRAARAAALMIEAGARRGLLVVGTCGGLARQLAPGTIVHCTRAIQADLGLRDGREASADADLAERWQAVAPGASALFLTADRAVLSHWRRWRLGIRYGEPCVADMETAAAAAVASAAGVPWAALRAVTDGGGWFGAASFHLHFPAQAGRAADTVPALLAEMVRSSAGPAAGKSGDRSPLR